MPQMKPLLWVHIMLTTILIMLTLTSLIYFFPLKLLPKSASKKKLFSSNNFKKIYWTW